MKKPLPTEAADGRALVALRVTSHRARSRVERETADQIEEWVGISSESMRWPHVYLIPADLWDKVANIGGVSRVSRFRDVSLSWGPAIGTARTLTRRGETLPRIAETSSTECLDAGLSCSIDPLTGRCTECGQAEIS